MSEQHKPSPASVPLQQGHRTYHLVPFEVWERQKDQPAYLPEMFGQHGFIHCTDSLDELVAVGNRYYQDDPRTYLVLRIECDRVESEIVYEDPQQIFPHIYGPLQTQAVDAVLSVERGGNGRFLAIR